MPFNIIQTAAWRMLIKAAEETGESAGGLCSDPGEMMVGCIKRSNGAGEK